jgi:flagellar hook assembly protein FlgD
MKGENSMNRMLMTAVATLALLVSSTMLWGHDERLHGANAVTGQITAVSADGMDLKVRDNTVKVKFSSKTNFEHDKKAVDKSHVKVGDRAGVVGNKLPTGEWMANEVILGLPAPNPSAKSGSKK